MANIRNPRKVFQFRVEIDGFEQFAAQKVTVPELEIEAVEHGDTNHMVKTAGMVKIGDIVIDRLRPLPQFDNAAFLWFTAAQDTLTGGGSLPEVYKRTIVISEMDNSGKIAVNRWICTGCWVKKLGQNDFDRMSSDNVIESITLSVDRVQRL